MAAPRERYIPLRKRELLDALLAHDDLPAPAQPGLEALARRLALLFHVEFFVAREALKELYVRLSPDRPGDGPIAPAPEERETFLAALESALVAANFSEIAESAVFTGIDAAGRVSARVAVPREMFDRVRIFGRGRRLRPIRVPAWFGLGETTQAAPVHDHVVLVAEVRAPLPARLGRGSRLRPGAIYLKLFRDIPEADLRTLFPNARIVMGLRDKLILGVPAVAGGVPVMLNIVPAVSVLLVVLGAWLGVAGTVEKDALKQALAALSGLGALGGFLLRQWMKYERQKLRYQKQVAENAYFNSMNNNAGLFDTLIGQSEDSEVKEAVLAYGFLLMAEGPLDRRTLDARIEAWLAARFGVDVDFEIEDALGKLERLGLVHETAGAGLSAIPLDAALARTAAAIARFLEADGPAGATAGPTVSDHSAGWRMRGD